MEQWNSGMMGKDKDKNNKDKGKRNKDKGKNWIDNLILA
jgi:hypothetical protein